ncbi:UDP-galactose-lipid carrier transferase [hydrothermal vent metagenome]|uniref:UDP-galactose-lipid carrier transferase n=1 Tax=hydrothermal vent metagenome TaxID=652676 RepID=A0A3B1E0T3_9ZZZZ
MNLKDFNTTSHKGLFVSKKTHPSFGKKYIARFQLNKKRYVKVLGYEIKNKLTELKALGLLQQYKNTIRENKSTLVKNKEMKTKSKIDNADELSFVKSILGDYQSIDPTFLQKGIQKIYDNEELKQYQIELIKMQKYLEKTKKKMIILFEGRDASGKGGAIRKMTRYMNARHYRVVALGKPTETQKHQWFFQKYIEHFPTGGEVVLFDRSWYNRAMVEPVFGFCSPEQYEVFMEDVVNFEHDLVRQDIMLVKLYFSVSKEQQKQRFEDRRTSPLKQWKLSEVDLQAQDLWDDFSAKKYEMLKRTSSRSAPWNIVRSNNKHKARMEAVKIILNSTDYDNRNYSLNFTADENINISVQKELSRMRNKKDY